MGEKKIKDKQYLPHEKVSSFLRMLADGIDRGTFTYTGGEYSLEELEGYKLTIESNRLYPTVKMKSTLLPRQPVMGPEREGVESYRDLKKRMNRAFKGIGAHLKEGLFPDRDLMTRFYQECLQMTGYPGKGDNRYEDFRGVANRLMAAVERGSLEEARLAYSDMNNIMDTCHMEFK